MGWWNNGDLCSVGEREGGCLSQGRVGEKKIFKIGKRGFANVRRENQESLQMRLR